MKKSIKIITILLGIFITCLLVACKKSPEYEVVFDSNGGTVVENQKVKEGEKIKKPKDPVKEGFTFKEWRCGGEIFDFDTTIKEDVVLVAVYEVNEGTEIVVIAYNADNGQAVQTVEVAKGNPVSKPPNPKKDGHIFKGWYLNEEKYDFTQKVDESIVLIAKWEVDKTTGSKDTSDSKQNSTENKKTGVSTTNQNNVSSGMVKLSEVEGLWYAEGRNDVTINFYIYDTNFVMINGIGFDIYSGDVEYTQGRGGTEYLNNGSFYCPAVALESASHMVYTKNGKTTNFYRQADYPKHIDNEYEKTAKAMCGCYWYLDGYQYAYLKASIVDRETDQIVAWESENILIKNNKLTAYENYDYAEYKTINSGASSHVHNALMINPLTGAKLDIEKYNIKIKNNKLYMTIGDTEYRFTKYSSRKKDDIKLSFDSSTITKSVGETFTVITHITPFFLKHSLTAKSSNKNVVGVWTEGPSSSIDGNVKITFRAYGVGTASITVTDAMTGAKNTFTVNVEPVNVTSVSLNKTAIELSKGETETLKATVAPSNATDKTITWSSSDSKVASVSSSGKVTAVSFGTATITAKSSNGSCSASCQVTVKQEPLTVKGSIGLMSRVSEGNAAVGIGVEVKASGGSENYVAYSIKLYYGNTLIGESNSKEIFVTPANSGTYRAEVWVKDSSGNEASSTSTTTISF